MDFADILHRSGLGDRRPVEDVPRLQKMLDQASLIITARSAGDGKLVGIARSLTDWSYATYLSDLAVDRAVAGRGIGRRLIEETRDAAGTGSMLLLVASPDAEGYYDHIGMPRSGRAFLYPRAE